MPSNWSVTRDQIKEILKNRSIEAEVEIQNRKPKAKRSLLTLKPEDKTIRIYEIVRDKLLQIIEEHLSTAWGMIYIAIGTEKSNAEPALLVFVDQGTVKDWSTLTIKLK
ncbi:hypothetical protein MMC31_005636 [Peltigera leucophlebia]|nr:hypothetical protein [Peltigera leucophlebia]